MKIEAEKLRKFVVKASLNHKMLGINLNFEENGLTSSIKDPAGIVMTNIKLNKESFEEYEVIGELFIRNTDLFCKTLNTFNDKIKIEKTDEYVIKISDEKREADIILGSAEMINDYVFRETLPVIKTTTKVSLKKSDLARGLADMVLLKEQKILIEHNENKLTFSVGKRKGRKTNSFVTTIETENTGIGKVKVAESITNLFNSLDSTTEIILEFGTDVPLVLTEKSEEYTFVCLIAPDVGED